VRGADARENAEFERVFSSSRLYAAYLFTRHGTQLRGLGRRLSAASEGRVMATYNDSVAESMLIGERAEASWRRRLYDLWNATTGAAGHANPQLPDRLPWA